MSSLPDRFEGAKSKVEALPRPCCLERLLPCNMKILQVLIFANFADWPQCAKISPRRKKTCKIKHHKNWLPSVKLKTLLLKDLCHWGVISGLKHNAVVCYASKTIYKEPKMSSEQKFSSSDWCEWVIWRNTSGLFGDPQIANKSLLVTVTTESESEDEEYDLTNDSQNEERTGSNCVASHSCSSGTSAAACTDVVSILETSTEQESVIIIDYWVCLIVSQ